MTQNTTTTQTTTLTYDQKEFANELAEALQSKKPLLEDDWTNLVTDENSAYQVQEAFTDLKDDSVGGYKVSLTSKQTQDMFDSNEPLYGAEMTNNFLKSTAVVSLKNLMEPLVEVELCFRTKEDLLPTDSLEDLLEKNYCGTSLGSSRLSLQQLVS